MYCPNCHEYFGLCDGEGRCPFCHEPMFHGLNDVEKIAVEYGRGGPRKS